MLITSFSDKLIGAEAAAGLAGGAGHLVVVPGAAWGGVGPIGYHNWDHWGTTAYGVVDVLSGQIAIAGRKFATVTVGWLFCGGLRGQGKAAPVLGGTVL